MKITENQNLKSYNTFGFDVECRNFLQIENENEIFDDVYKLIKETQYYILGGGSNTLFTGNFSGIIVHPAFSGIEITENDQDFVILKVAAGESWDNLINFCVKNEYYGIENLTGIPGNVGSAPVQNIGAYGCEVKDSILKVEGFCVSEKKQIAFDNKDCRFKYRDSIFKSHFKNDFIITYVWFRLSKKADYNLSYNALKQRIESNGITLNLANISNCIRAIRDEKLPDYKTIGNGGSFFKNPIVATEEYEHLRKTFPELIAFDTADEKCKKLSAGQLIEKAGWKGKRIGDAGVYPKQALVLVNYGSATPKDILDLSAQIATDVKEMFGIEISKEINCV